MCKINMCSVCNTIRKRYHQHEIRKMSVIIWNSHIVGKHMLTA